MQLNHINNIKVDMAVEAPWQETAVIAVNQTHGGFGANPLTNLMCLGNTSR